MLFNNKYPYIIAEIGCNHNGDMDLAKRMIKSAKECGCDAIKLQLWKKEELWTNDHLKELNDGIVKLEHVDKWETKELGLNNIFDQLDAFSFYYDEHIELFKYARELGIDYSSTVSTKAAIDFLIDEKAAFIKIPSPDVTNMDFLEYVFSKNYPVVLSTGLASLGEIEHVVQTIPDKNKDKTVLLHCISVYPPPYNTLNLKFINTLKELFSLQVGYSDHALGTSSVLAAVCCGASVIEKHFTMDRNMPGWDHCISVEPLEMKFICEETKKVYDALGHNNKIMSKNERENIFKFRKSIIINKDLKQKHILTREDITFKRPGTGIRADQYQYVLGHHINKDIKKDSVLFWQDII